MHIARAEIHILFAAEKPECCYAGSRVNMDGPMLLPTVFSKNRDRRLKWVSAKKSFARVLKQPRANGPVVG